MLALRAFGARCFTAARPSRFAPPFQRRMQAAGVLGFGGGPLVATPTPAIVVDGVLACWLVGFAPAPQPARASTPATTGTRLNLRVIPAIYTA
jgi:hypothetical protein